MSVTRFACPACHAVLQSANPLEEGRKIKCHECGVIFPVRQLDPSQLPQPVAAAVPASEPAAASQPAHRKRPDYDKQLRVYERQQEKTRNVMMAMGSILVLLLLTGLVVGLFALADKSPTNSVAQNAARPSGGSSARGVPSEPAAEAGAKGTAGEEEETPRQSAPKSDPPRNDDALPSGGAGASSITDVDRERPRMPKPGEGMPRFAGGAGEARGNSIPGFNNGKGDDRTYPGYPPGYKPPEGKESESEGDSRIIPGDTGLPSAPGVAGSGGVRSVGGKSLDGAPPSGKAPPGYPQRPGIPGRAPSGSGGAGKQLPGSGGSRPGDNSPQLPGYPPNTEPPPNDPDPFANSKLPDLPVDWPKYRTEYPNQGLEVSFKNTLNYPVVIGMRSQKSNKGFDLGTDINVEPGQSGEAYLKKGEYEIFLVSSKDSAQTHSLGKIHVLNVATFQIAKEDTKFLLRK